MDVKVKTSIALVSSLFFTALGVCLLVLANVGSDAVTMLCSGINRYFNISLGNASNIVNVLVLFAACIVGKKYIGFTTFAACLLMGSVINVLNPFVINIVTPFMNSTVNIYLVFFLGLFFESFGCALLIYFKTGMNQLDALASGMVDTFRIKYQWVRTGIDILMFICGMFLGAEIGLGTIICVCSMGTIINFCVFLMNYIFHYK